MHVSVCVYVCVCVCIVCVCVCVCERERERERNGGGGRERERGHTCAGTYKAHTYTCSFTNTKFHVQSFFSFFFFFYKVTSLSVTNCFITPTQTHTHACVRAHTCMHTMTHTLTCERSNRDTEEICSSQSQSLLLCVPFTAFTVITILKTITIILRLIHFLANWLHTASFVLHRSG